MTIRSSGHGCSPFKPESGSGAPNARLSIRVAHAAIAITLRCRDAGMVTGPAVAAQAMPVNLERVLQVDVHQAMLPLAPRSEVPRR